MSSVRDRIRAAEALQGADKPHNGSPTHGRGQKLSLKTDEHIKEEFLRRGDGGWSKNVDIGQQQLYATPPSMPYIKVTAETPVVQQPERKLPGKLSKDVPGAFETVAEEAESVIDAPSSKHESSASGPSLAEQRYTEKEAERSDVEVPVSKYEGLLDDADSYTGESGRERSGRSRSRSKHRQPSVEVFDEADLLDQPREKVIFDPGDPEAAHEDISPRSNRRRRASKSHRHRSEHREEQRDIRTKETRSRSRRKSSTQGETPRSDKNVREWNDDEQGPARSPSRQDYYHSSHESPTRNARRSSGSLWPSFSLSERRSMSDVFERGREHRSSSLRSARSTTSMRSDRSPQRIDIAEYIAGKKVEHAGYIPPKAPTKPLGYVRSRSSTGEVSQFYTRERRLLRRPSDDEILPRSSDDRGRRERKHASLDSATEQQPWQVKLMQGIARM